MKEERSYEYLWRNKWITSEAETIDDFIETYESLAEMFREWREDGIELGSSDGVSDDYAYFVTTDPIVAEKYGFEDMEDIYGDFEEDEVENYNEFEEEEDD